VNFTREPIIETIITPRDGYKLLVRNSKGGGQEDYFVDALEVVSFGSSFFFRSLERPKSFIVPVSDYEVLEVKEARVALKNAPHERSIKIGGGRDSSPRPAREPAFQKEEAAPSQEEVSEGEEDESGQSQEPRADNKKRDRRRNRRRRGPDDQRAPRDWEDKPQTQEGAKEEPEINAAEPATGGGGAHSDETQVSSSTFTRLIPPPPTLISETISRYKDLAISSRPVLPKHVEETASEEKTEESSAEDSPKEPKSSKGPHQESEQNFLTQKSFLEDNNFLT